MIADILESLVRASLAGSLGVLIALALRIPVRRAFGPGLAYALWVLPPAMAVASLLPGPRSLSLGLPAAGLDETTGSMVFAAWLAGGLVLAGAMIMIHGRFLRALGKPALDAAGLPILRARDGSRFGPAVVGLIGPKIVLPADFDQRFSEKERAMVLAHERSHLFGHDAQAIGLAAALRCLNWFNPLAHLAGHCLRIDQELACDAAVLAQYPKARRTYAEALMKTQFAAAVPPFGCQWPSRSKSPLEQRIALLSAPPIGFARRRLGAAFVAVMVLAASALAWAVEAPALVARPPAQLQLWAILKNDVALLERIRPTLLASGEAFPRVYTTGEGTFSVILTPVLQPGGKIAIFADIEGRGRQEVVLEEGEPRTFRIGDRNLLVTAKVAPE